MTPALVFLLALGVRLVALVGLADVDPIPPYSDMRTYYEQALGLAAGTWPPPEPFYFHPLMSYFVHGSFQLFGVSTFAPRLLNCFVSAAHCALTAELATRLFDRRVGLWTGGLLAIHQGFVYYAGAILDVPITSCAVAALCWLAVLPSLRAALVVGVVSGLGALGRGSLVLCIAALLVRLLIAKRYAVAGAFAASVLLVLAPVLARNVQYDCLCLSNNGYVNFWIGNNPWAPGWYAFRPSPGDPEVTSSAWLWRTLELIAHDPGRWVELLLHKTFLFFFAADGGVPEQANLIYFGVMRLPWLSYLPGTLPLCVVALIGLFLLMRARARETLAGLSLVWVSYFVGTVLFFYETRFRLPIVTLYVVLAAYTLDRGVRRLRR